MDQLLTDLGTAVDPSSGPPIIALIIAVTGIMKQAICGKDRARSDRFGRLIALVVALCLLLPYELYRGSGIYDDTVKMIVDALVAMGVVYSVKHAGKVYTRTRRTVKKVSNAVQP